MKSNFYFDYYIPMKILICAATSGELKTVKNQIKWLNLKVSLQIDYLCTWIGNYSTIYTLTKYLTEHPDCEFFLVNIGICGYMSQEHPPKMIQIWRIKNATTDKELLPPIPFEFGKIVSIRSSETILKERSFEEDGFVDMESRGFEFVADQFRFPRILIKIPYDKVGIETQQFEKKKACQMLTENINYRLLIEKLLQFE